MKPILRKLGFILSLSVISSCHEHNDTGPQPGPNGTRLAKVIVSIQSKPVTTITYDYLYDDLGRVTGINYSHTNAVHENLGSSSQKWLYNGDDRLPYKSTGTINLTPNAEQYYFYDNNGRLIKDSLTQAGCNNCFAINKYQWFSDKVLTTSNSNGINGNPPTHIADSGVINNNNITQDYILSNTSGQITGNQISYDNKLNPFNTLNIHAAMPFSQPDGLSSIGFSRNNDTVVISGVLDANGTFSSVTQANYKYEYNAHDLPTNCVGYGKRVFNSSIQFLYTN